MSLMNKKGFTLLELVVAVGIFAFAIYGILLLFINSATLDNTNRNKTIATSHAETALEYIRSLGFSTTRQNLCSGKGSWSLPLQTINLSGLNNEEPINITTIPPDCQDCCTTNPLDITVTVTWKDMAQAITRTLALGTSISND